MVNHSIKKSVPILSIIIMATAMAWGAPVKTPDDFAQLKDPGYEFKYRAISFDEVTIALKLRKNDPKGDVKFWSKVLKEKIPLVYGYTFVEESNVTTDKGRDGTLLQFEVDQEDGKYLYLVGVFIKKKKMWLFEAGGRHEAFKAHEKDIIRAIKSMKI